MTKSVVAYARVSTARQGNEGFSIPAQLDLLRNYARQNGFKILEEFVDRESAKVPGRKNFSRMLRLVKQAGGEIEILVEKTDRLYRNLEEYVEVRKLGAAVHFVKEATIYRASDESQLLQTVKSAMAEEFILNLRREVIKGMGKKAELGIYPSRPPLGYLNVDKGIELDPFRADQVRQCFQWKAEGLSYKEVSKKAYDAGLRTHCGKRLSPGYLHKLLTNPFYYGWFNWRGQLYQGTHTPLVTKAECDAAQNRRAIVTRKHSFPFRGLLVCSLCGRTFTAERKKRKYTYYRCAQNCGAKWIREDRLQDALSSSVIAPLEIDARLAELIRRALLEAQLDKRKRLESMRTSLRTRRSAAERRLEAIWEAKVTEEVTEATYARMRAKYEQELAAIGHEESRLEHANENFLQQGERLLELCKGLHERYLRQSADEQASASKSSVRTFSQTA